MEEINPYMLWMIIIASIGYLLIIFESLIDINKTTSALMTAVLLWILQFASQGESNGEVLIDFSDQLSKASQVIVFLLGALIIVEIINAHKGFKVLTDYMMVRSKRQFLWLIGFIAFFLSAILDNLTTTIIMITVMRKVVENPSDRLIIGGGIVAAANAGGVWTPIGDITTTMLWINDRISTLNTVRDLFIPGLTCLAVSLGALSFALQGKLPHSKVKTPSSPIEPFGIAVLILGLGLLISVPIFKHLTGLPPFMGIIFALSTLWFFTDLAHRTQGGNQLMVSNILSKVDISGPLFFLGILLAINALETGGVLPQLARFINSNISDITLLAIMIGLASAVVDNIPLVAVTIGTYSLAQYPTDSHFWQLIAYCAGTGGTILAIGSAAGIVFMGLEKVDFFSYVKRVSLPSLLGYFAGIAAYWFFR